MNSKRIKVNTLARQYAIRRLMRTGRLVVSDIIRATGCSKPLATEVMATLREEYPSAIKKTGVSLQLVAPPPSWIAEVNDAQLLNAIINGAKEVDTGLVVSGSADASVELPLRINRWSAGKLPDGLLSAITQCFLRKGKPDHRSSIEIEYVGMRQGEAVKWRRVFPIGIECVMEQWRLIAQDLSAENHPAKTYVLSRIKSFRPAVEPLPKQFRRALFRNTQNMVDVTLNPALTKDQEDVIRNELGINDNSQIQIDNRMEFEFLRRYDSQPVTDGTVWPIVTSIGSKKCT